VREGAPGAVAQSPSRGRAAPARLRVALDVTVAGRPGGIGVYARRLLESLGPALPDAELVAWCGDAAAMRAVAGVAPEGAVVAGGGFTGRCAVLAGRFVRLDLFTVERLAGPVDVLHGLDYFLPARRGRAALVVSVHDLSALRHPEWHPRRRALAHRWSLARAARAASCVITPTDAVRGDVIDALGLPPDRVAVVNYGISHAFRPRHPAEIAATLARYGLAAGDYVLHLGALEPRKNLPALLDAMALARARRPDLPPLVLAGPPGWRNAGLRRRLGTAGVRHVGYVGDDAAAALLAGALLFVYPSLYEGFGLPPVEAMASGTPVVASADPALAEVLGDAALLVDPRDPEALADAIVRALDDTALRTRLRALGLARAQRFTWERAAAETAAVYAAAVAGRSRA